MPVKRKLPQKQAYVKKRNTMFRPSYQKPFQKTFSQRVKEIVRKEAEAPHHSIWDITATTIYHGQLYTSSLVTEIPQGTSNQQRIGDEIFIEAFKARFMMTVAPTTVTISYRVMLIKSGKEVLAGTSGGWNSASGLNPADVFFVANPGGDGNFPGRGIVNPKAATVLYDQTFEFNEDIASQTICHNVPVTIPIHAKHVYNANGGYAKFKNYYWLVAAYQNGGTIGTTNCGNIAFDTDIIFKNEA